MVYYLFLTNSGNFVKVSWISMKSTESVRCIKK